LPRHQSDCPDLAAARLPLRGLSHGVGSLGKKAFLAWRVILQPQASPAGARISPPGSSKAVRPSAGVEPGTIDSWRRWMGLVICVSRRGKTSTPCSLRTMPCRPSRDACPRTLSTSSTRWAAAKGLTAGQGAVLPLPGGPGVCRTRADRRAAQLAATRRATGARPGGGRLGAYLPSPAEAKGQLVPG